MSSEQPLTSSGSEDPQYAVVDERKKKRMLSNRRAVRRLRQKKQQHLDDLLGQVTQLQKQNSEMVQRSKAYLQHNNRVESENQILRARLAELNDRSESLNSFLVLMEDTSNLLMITPEISDPLLKPWQLPCSS